MIKFLVRAVLLLLIVVAVVFAIMLGRATHDRHEIEELHQGAAALKVIASGFANGADLPAELTCHGAGHSPAVAWSAAPKTTRSYALLLVDFDVPSPDMPLHNFVHWSVYNMPASVTHLDPAVEVATLQSLNDAVGQNSAGQLGYAQPCPPMGRHRYVLGVYALDVPMIQPASPAAHDVVEALKGHVIAYGEVDGHSS